LVIILADLIARMVALNPDLHSYSATMHAHVALSSFPFLSTDIVATYYHKDPDRDKLEITSGLPAVAQGFSQLYPRIEPPARWNALYVVTQTGDDGKATTFRLVPRSPGNVQKIAVTVDDATATIRSMRWDYANGGWASMDNRYGQVQGKTVVTSQSGHVEEPNYKGDITTTLSGYQLNPDLPDSLFGQ
jgi:outer membrane lipoprotein-sorting protein